MAKDIKDIDMRAITIQVAMFPMMAAVAIAVPSLGKPIFAAPMKTVVAAWSGRTILS